MSQEQSLTKLNEVGQDRHINRIIQWDHVVIILFLFFKNDLKATHFLMCTLIIFKCSFTFEYVHFLTEKYVNADKQGAYVGPCGSALLQPW